MNNEFDDHDPTLSDMGGDEGLPPGVGDFGGQSGFTTSEAPSAIQRHAGGALLLAVVIGVAIAGLLSMRTLTRASAAMESPTEVEKSIETFLGMVNSTKASANKSKSGEEAVLDVLSESYTQRQVPLTDVQRNPFLIFEPTDAPPKTTGRPEVDPRVEQVRVRTQQMERAGGRLRLGSVMMGNRPLANINNKVLRVGDTIDVDPEGITFTVKSIEASSVELVAVDAELDITVPVTVTIRRNR